MSAREIDYAKLRLPFPVDAVSWRVGSTNKKKFEKKETTERKGQALPYIDARDVMERLDDVCGPENWRDSYQLTQNGTMLCKLEIRIDGEWVWKCDGAGSTEMEAEKGQVSDALKRAAVKWGIGRYLYSFEAPWLELDAAWRIPRNEYVKLRKLLMPNVMPALSPGKAFLAPEPATLPIAAAEVPAPRKTVADIPTVQSTQDRAASVPAPQSTSDKLAAIAASKTRQRAIEADLKKKWSAEVRENAEHHLGKIDVTAANADELLNKRWLDGRTAHLQMTTEDQQAMLEKFAAKRQAIKDHKAKPIQPGAFRPGEDDPLPAHDLETGELLS